eukprot:RCo051799
MAEITEQSAGTLQGTLERSAGAVMDAFAVSQEQVLAMSAELLSRNLAQFIGDVQDFLGSVQRSVHASYLLISSMGVNINSLDQTLALAPHFFSLLRFERTYSIAFFGAFTGDLVIFMDQSSFGHPPLAIIVPRFNESMSSYAVNATSFQVLYPATRCTAGTVVYCNQSFKYSDLQLVELGSSLGAGELQYSPPQTALGAVPFKFLQLVTAIRMADNTLVGALCRTTDILALEEFLKALLANEPLQRMYLVDLPGTLLASSNIDPAFTAPFNKPRPYENVLAYPEAIVNQSARFLLQKYGSWANLSFGRLEAANLTNLTTGQAEEYFVQAARVQVLNLDWVAVCVLPVRLHEGKVLDAFAVLGQKIVQQSASLVTEVESFGMQANAKIGALMTEL